MQAREAEALFLSSFGRGVPHRPRLPERRGQKVLAPSYERLRPSWARCTRHEAKLLDARVASPSDSEPKGCQTAGVDFGYFFFTFGCGSKLNHQETTRGPQVLVIGSIYQGSILGTHF